MQWCTKPGIRDLKQRKRSKTVNCRRCSFTRHPTRWKQKSIIHSCGLSSAIFYLFFLIIKRVSALVSTTGGRNSMLLTGLWLVSNKNRIGWDAPHQRGTMKPKQSIWLNDFCSLEAKLKAEEPGQTQLWFNCMEITRSCFYRRHTVLVLFLTWQVFVKLHCNLSLLFIARRLIA